MGVKEKNKTKRLQYSKEDVLHVLKEVKRGESIARVSRKYRIPESTLRAKKENKYSDKKPGPASMMSTEEEEEVVNWIFHCCKAGFPVTKSQLLISVQGICKNLKNTNPFTDDLPGGSWYESFLKRHPEISTKISENVCLNRAKVTEQSLRNWYSETSKYLSSENLLIIKPERVYNSDETGKNINENNIIYYIILKNDRITIETPKSKYFNLQEFLHMQSLLQY